jgi:polyhydroxybutyrate depolymerase
MPNPRTPPSIAWIVLAAVVVTGLASCSERRPDRRRDPTTEITVPTADGRERSALLYIPASLSDGPVPLLVALHGGGGSGAQYQETSGYDDLADDNGFLVVYPDGIGSRLDDDLLRTWNGGVCCGRAARNEVDDVAFLRRLVAQLTDEHDIDADRVFATGHSNGMIMSYRLACEASDVFVAVAGQAGTLGIDDCAPAAPVSVLHLHGSADTSIPLDGGRGEGIARVDFPSPRDGIRTVAAADGCAPTPTVTTDGPAATETWMGCEDGTTVAFVTVDGASHAWMGADETTRPGAPEPFADHDASLAAWTFLAAHPRQH